MRIHKNDIPVKIDAPGAVVRQKTDLGDATGYGVMDGEHFSLAAGSDLAPLLKGLENDLCHSPHWGYVIEGEVTVTYKDGSEEQLCAGDLVYLPPHHTARVGKDAELVLFSPQHEHTQVLDHIKRKVSG